MSIVEEKLGVEGFKKLCEERVKWPITFITDVLQDSEKSRKWLELEEKKELFSPHLIENVYTGFLFDSFFDELIKCNPKEFWYIGRQDTIINFYEHYKNIPWKIQCIYQLDFYFYDIKLPKDKEETIITKDIYYLFLFTKKQIKKIELGFTRKTIDDLASYVDDSDDNNIIQIFKSKNIEKKYLTEFHPFLRIKNVKLNFELAYIPFESFYFKYFNLLSRYKNEVKKNYGLPKENEKFGPLKEFVEFINPIFIQEGDIYIVQDKGIYRDFYIDVYTDKKSLRKAPDGKVFITEGEETELPELIVENEIDYAFRCNNEDIIQYLYCFIDWRNTIIANFNYPGCHPFGTDIEDLPIFIPNDNLNKYINTNTSIIFKTIFLKKKIKFDNNHLKEIVTRDISEIQTCCDKGAYKAAIILAGSLLEAVLLAWISDISGDNFFEEEKTYQYTVQDDKTGEYKTQYASNLDGYIKAIQAKYHFENPPWDKNGPPDIIRQKRNLVHPKKLLFASDKQINKEACEEVLKYLNKIVNVWISTTNSN